jgi:hypothetical protein
MSALDTVLAAVEGSEKLDAGTKELVTAFLQAAGPAVMELSEDGLRAVMGAAADGTDVASVVAANLDAQGVLALLALTETQMGELAQQHEAEAKAAQAAVEMLQAAALTAMARALLEIF